MSCNYFSSPSLSFSLKKIACPHRIPKSYKLSKPYITILASLDFGIPLLRETRRHRQQHQEGNSGTRNRKISRVSHDVEQYANRPHMERIAHQEFQTKLKNLERSNSDQNASIQFSANSLPPISTDIKGQGKSILKQPLVVPNTIESEAKRMSSEDADSELQGSQHSLSSLSKTQLVKGKKHGQVAPIDTEVSKEGNQLSHLGAQSEEDHTDRKEEAGKSTKFTLNRKRSIFG